MAYILSTPTLTGDNAYLQKYIKIYYRLDSAPEIYEYVDPIETDFSIIHYWITLSSKTDNIQLQVLYDVVEGVGTPIPTLVY